MIQVKAPQISYVNEIVELVKVFYPEEKVINIDHAGKQTLKNINMLDETREEYDFADDMVLETGYQMQDADTYLFFAYLWMDENLVCEHKTSSSFHNAGDISLLENKPYTEISKNKYRDTSNCFGNARSRKINQVIKNAVKGCVFDLLSKFTGKHPKWGAMTGIRPVKVVHELLESGLDETGIRKELLGVYKLQAEKADLLLRTAHVQRPLTDQPGNNKVSVYIHIPFCSTRCLYCSFPSDLISRVSGKMDLYLDCLEREISFVMDKLLSCGKKADTVYIGGGTPTVLGHAHLKKLLELVQKHILSQYSILEYTVEAGRPDSLDRSKLQLMKDHGVTRLSINPQSMNQETLDLVGRNHTVGDIIQVYGIAKKTGFDCINMDVILGLPNETAQHMERTMEGITALKPDNITVHTLAVKRASVFKDTFQQYNISRKGLAEEMADVCRIWLDKLGMEPYYLYRQKYMLDHLENVGYGLPGKECLYNIQFMNEKRSIWAFGAGASSKIHHAAEDRLERTRNVKNLDEYLFRIEEMIERKKKAFI